MFLQCVYAHSKEELRKKPAELENRNKNVASTGGRLIPATRKYEPWAGEDKHLPNLVSFLAKGVLLAGSSLVKCCTRISAWRGMPVYYSKI